MTFTKSRISREVYALSLLAINRRLCFGYFRCIQVTQRHVWNINNVVEIYHFYEKRPLKISSGLLLYQSYAKAKPRFFVTRVYTRHRKSVSDYFHFWSASASISVALFRLDLVITRPWFSTFSRKPPHDLFLQNKIFFKNFNFAGKNQFTV